MSREEYNENDFIMNKDKRSVLAAEVIQGVHGFGVGGREVDVNSDECLCKTGEIPVDINNTKDLQTIYFVRMDTSGWPYDPWGMDEGQSGKFDSTSGVEEWPHTRVRFVVFEQYLQFLRTHNRAHLLNAQRLY